MPSDSLTIARPCSRPTGAPDRPTPLGEPRAAVFQMASARGLAPGSTVAVYDLGGRTFDAAVVRTASGAGDHEVLGRVECDDRLGGAAFDDAIFEHVRTTVPHLFAAVDGRNVDDLAAVARVRQACTRAKEKLSSHTETSIPVVLSGRQTTVRLHRSTFEVLIRPLVERTIATLEHVITSAGVGPSDLTELLLVGGSSRIPLVSRLLSERFGRRPVVVDDDPGSDAVTVPGLPAVPPARPERSTTAAEPAWVAPAVDPPPHSLRRSIAGYIVLGAVMTVVTVVSVAICILVAYPTPAVGQDETVGRRTTVVELLNSPTSAAVPAGVDPAPERSIPVAGTARSTLAAIARPADPHAVTPPAKVAATTPPAARPVEPPLTRTASAKSTTSGPGGTTGSAEVTAKGHGSAVRSDVATRGTASGAPA